MTIEWGDPETVKEYVPCFIVAEGEGELVFTSVPIN